MKLLNGLVVFDLCFAGLGALSAWYTDQTWAYFICAQIAIGGILVKFTVKAYDSIKSSWFPEEKR